MSNLKRCVELARVSCKLLLAKDSDVRGNPLQLDEAAEYDERLERRRQHILDHQVVRQFDNVVIFVSLQHNEVFGKCIHRASMTTVHLLRLHVTLAGFMSASLHTPMLLYC